MEKHESNKPVADSVLPRPVVLKPEDLAAVAAAGAAMMALAPSVPMVLGNVIRAGGMPAGPYMI